MQRLSPQKRLRVCALVCKAWNTATAAATTIIEVCARSDQQIAAFSSWLSRHGTHLEQLQRLIYSAAGLPLQLPSKQLKGLQHLSIHNVFVEDYTVGNINNWRLLTSLTYLSLNNVEFETVREVARLSEFSHLQHLKLKDGALQVLGSEEDQQVLPTVIAALASLTKLNIHGFSGNQVVTSQVLDSLSMLPGFKVFKLCHAQVAKPHWQHMPTQLQELTIKCHGFPHTPVVTSHLSRLTTLQKLCMHGYPHLGPEHKFEAYIDPLWLSPLVQLRTLVLSDCQLTCAYTRTDTVNLHYSYESADALLDVLPLMSKLRHLDLSGVTYGHVGTMASEPSRYSALMASSKLTNLCLIDFAARSRIIHHMLAAKQMPALTVIELGRRVHGKEALIAQLLGVAGQEIDAEGLGLLVDSCPALQKLTLLSCLAPHCSIAALQRLSLLRKVTMTGGNMSLSTMEELKGMKVLRSLHIERARGLSFPGNGVIRDDSVLVGLTQLTQLTKLQVQEFDVPIDATPGWIGVTSDLVFTSKVRVAYLNHMYQFNLLRSPARTY